MYAASPAWARTRALVPSTGPIGQIFLVAESGPRPYRARRPRGTPLDQLLEAHYERVKLLWEERFESRYGTWRSFVDDAVARYLDCGILEHGFARVDCDACQHDFLVAFSCKGRGLCPSCGAKRAARFAAFLREQVLEPVPHAQWVFTIPKMLRPYFLHHRELLGPLCRAAYETVRELIAEATAAEVRPGMVTVVQTFGDHINPHPHLHAIASRGGWDRDGTWFPVPYVDHEAAERLFRHKVLKLLERAGLLADERIDLLLSWRHSGFSVHNAVTLEPGDSAALERLARYLLRPPVSLARTHWDEQAGLVRYDRKDGHDQDGHADTGPGQESFDPLEFIARVLVQIPAPRLHLARYFGAYSNVARARRRQPSAAGDRPAAPAPSNSPLDSPDSSDGSSESDRRSELRRRWADLIRRIYDAFPLVCPRCGGAMRILAFITERRVIRKILDHLEKRHEVERGPPAEVSSEPLN